MNLRFFKIPVSSINKAEAELNQFLSKHRISSMEKEFVDNGSNSFWAISVEIMESSKQPSSLNYKNRVDYKAILSEQDFSVYVRLRDLRKERSVADGVPAYAVFTNQQLATMVTERVRSKSGMSAIEGVGEAKVEKYGDMVLALLKRCWAEHETEKNITKPNSGTQ